MVCTGGIRIAGLSVVLAFLLVSCAGGSGNYAPMPAPAPGYKVGKPYKINGKRYFPRHDPSYDQVGTASWYGDQFHGKQTANGEIFNMWALTAAHPTLTLPADVRVTNLENNRSVILRVNDRGPFARDRIIDVSRAAAAQLGFLENGTARVRVQYLGLASLRGGARFASTDEAAVSTPLVTASLGARPATLPVTMDDIAREEVKDFDDADTDSNAGGMQLRSSVVPRFGGPSPSSGIATSALSGDPSDDFVRERPRPSIIPLQKPDRAAVPAPEVMSVPHADGQLFYVSEVFLDGLEAELARQAMADYGTVAIEPKSDSNLGDFYVVKVGPYDNRVAADTALMRLRAAGHKGAIITMK